VDDKIGRIPRTAPAVDAKPEAHIEPGCVYVVATPIGNLSDLSLRARAVLSGCDLIACENTRKIGRILSYLGIPPRPCVSYHERNESDQALRLTALAITGKSIALLSEAGTPTISDPGFRFVRECRRQGVRLYPVPGPSAILAALAVSGLPSDGFLFIGFLPPKKSARQRFFREHTALPYTIVCYESKHRIGKFLQDLVATLGPDRTIFVGRELTKLHESHHVGAASTVAEEVAAGSPKGEFVVLIAKDGFRI
jgi:16S rRNA (cytidine1402-2'-O)-methyltransferase